MPIGRLRLLYVVFRMATKTPKTTMKVHLSKIFIAATLLLIASCSGYNKLLRHGSSEDKYEKALELYNNQKYNKALTLFKEVETIFGHSDRADSIMFYIGVCYFRIGDYVSSGEQFNTFRETFRRSPFLEEAEYYFAKGFYYSSSEPENDQTNTLVAMQAIGEYLERYPNSHKKEDLAENLLDLRQRLYDKAYLNAKLYYDIGYYNSAVTALNNAIKRYPDSNHREELLFLIVCSHYEFAKNSVALKQRQRYLDMQDAYYTFIEEYPESTYRKDADKMFDDAKTFLDKFKDEDPGAVTTAVDEDTDQVNASTFTPTEKTDQDQPSKKKDKDKRQKEKKSKKSDNSEAENGTEKE